MSFPPVKPLAFPSPAKPVSLSHFSHSPRERQGFLSRHRLLSPPPLGGGGCPGRGRRGYPSLRRSRKNHRMAPSEGAVMGHAALRAGQYDALSWPCRATLPRQAGEGKASGFAS